MPCQLAIKALHVRCTCHALLSRMHAAVEAQPGTTAATLRCKVPCSCRPATPLPSESPTAGHAQHAPHTTAAHSPVQDAIVVQVGHGLCHLHKYLRRLLLAVLQPQLVQAVDDLAAPASRHVAGRQAYGCEQANASKPRAERSATWPPPSNG